MNRRLDQNVIKRLKKYYEVLKTQAETQHDQELAEWYDRFPFLQELDAQSVSLNVARLRADLLGDQEKVESISKRLDNLGRQRSQFLMEHDIPENYDQVQYHCPICHDTGLDGNAYCICARDILLTLNQRENPFLPPRMLDFENFQADFFSPEKNPEFFQGRISPRVAIKGIRKWLTDYCKNFERQKANLYFFGTPGTGKTFMLACVANQLIHQGFYIVYLKAVELFEILAKRRVLLNSFSPDPVEQDGLNKQLDLIRNCDLLCIDDLGVEAKGLLNTYADLIVLLDQRSESNLPVIITSNLTPRDLGEIYDERIRSRITGNFELTLFEGEDVRKRIAREKTGINNI